MAIVGELRTIVTADTKDLDKKLKQAQKTVESFGKDAAKGAEAAKGFGKGILQGATGLGGLTLGAAAAGAAVAALAVKLGQAAYAAYNQYNDTLDKIAYSTANVAKVQEGFMTANLRNAASLEQNATAASVVWGRLGRSVNKETETLVARLGKLQKEAGVTGTALQDMATVAQRFGMTSQLGTAFGYVLAAQDDTKFSIDEIAASMAAAAPLANHLGYSLGELARITQVLGNKGIGVNEWAAIMERQLKKFGYDTKAAKMDWQSLVKSINDPNYEGNKLKLLEQYGFEGSRALDMMQAIKSGAFSGGTLAPEALPSLKPGDLEEYLGTKWKAISDKLYDIVNAIWEVFKPGGKLEKIKENVDFKSPSVDDPENWFWQLFLPGPLGMTKPTGVRNEIASTATAPAFATPSPLAVGAAGGLQLDYMDSLVQMTVDADQATQKMAGGFNVFGAKVKKAFDGIARVTDYQFGYMRVVVGGTAYDIAENMGKAVWSIDTAFGMLDVDFTKLQEKLDAWGISVPTLFDNIIKGAERVGNDLLKAMGLDVTLKEVDSYLREVGATLQKYGVSIAGFWVDLTDGVATTTAEIGRNALDKLRILTGDIVMTLSEMFATGEWDWKKLWKKIWQGLLSIAIDYALKIIANSEMMMMAVQAIEAFIAGLSGDWLKLALITAGVAAAIGVTVGIVAAIKKSKEEQALEATPSSMGLLPSTYGAAPSSTVIIQNPQFVGSIDDRSAQAFGEGLARSLSIRGAVPQPVS